MPSYLRKKSKENEKKMLSTRVRTYVLDAFQNAAEDANKNGYILSLSSVVETALEHAISEYTEQQDIDFLKIERDKIEAEWQKQQEKDEQFQYEKHEHKMHIQMQEDAEIAMKEMDIANSEAYDRERLEQLENDKNALLTLNPAELKKYQDKRKKEVAEEDKKSKEMRKKIEARYKKMQKDEAKDIE